MSETVSESVSERWFPDDAPSPAANEFTRPFWDGCREHRLTLPRCSACGHRRAPYRVLCPACRSFDHTWDAVPGTGTVFTYAVVHQPHHPSLRGVVPYVAALVELDGTDGLRFLSNVVGTDPAAVQVGMAVRVAWEDMSDELSVPRFRPA